MTKFDQSNEKRVIRIPRQGKRKFWTCYKCKSTFHVQPEFKQHIAICGVTDAKQLFQCPFCSVKNARKRDLINKHITKFHGDRMFEIMNNSSLIVSVPKHMEEPPKQDDCYSLADDEDYIQELDHSIMGQMNLGSMSEREALDQQVSSDSKNEAISQPSRNERQSQTPTTTAETQASTMAECQEPMTSAGEADCQVTTDTDDSVGHLAQAGKADCQASVTIPVCQAPSTSSNCQATEMTSGVVAENISKKPPHRVPPTVYYPTLSGSVKHCDRATNAKTCCNGGMIPRGPKPQSKKKDPSEKCPHHIPLPVLELINREKHHPSGLKEIVKDIRINCPMCTPYEILREFGVHQYKK